jgi:hypothetical protein
MENKNKNKQEWSPLLVVDSGNHDSSNKDEGGMTTRSLQCCYWATTSNNGANAHCITSFQFGATTKIERTAVVAFSKCI